MLTNQLSKFLRGLFVGGGLFFMALTLGFFLQFPWATRLWPWPDGRLSYIFIASIAAAIAVPMIWIGLSGEFGAARGGAINLGVTAAGTTVFFFWLYLQDPQAQILLSALVSALGLVLNVGIFLWSRRIPFRDQRAMPGPVRVSFLMFTGVLLLVATLLVLRSPTVFPWPLKPQSSVIFGLIFLGAAFYFMTAVWQPIWHNARGQLLGFLAYDLVLIGPYLAHFQTVLPEHRLSLILYTGVLVYSGALSVYYLFLNPETRSWRIQAKGTAPSDLS